jgi:hypothetical protein
MALQQQDEIPHASERRSAGRKRTEDYRIVGLESQFAAGSGEPGFRDEAGVLVEAALLVEFEAAIGLEAAIGKAWIHWKGTLQTSLPRSAEVRRSCKKTRSPTADT